MTDGIGRVEQLAASKDGKLFLPSDLVALVNYHVNSDSYFYAEIWLTVTPMNFEQIIDTVKNQFIEFVLRLSESWHIESEAPSRNEVNRLVNVAIYNNSSGGNMPVFDQRNQHIQYQYNAAGNINISAVQTKVELAEQLEKLRWEVETAKSQGELDADTAVEAEYSSVAG